MSDDIEARRLLAAIYPTRFERVLGWLVQRCFKLAPRERGPFEWIAERLDAYQTRRWHRRADQGREFAGMKRRAGASGGR